MPLKDMEKLKCVLLSGRDQSTKIFYDSFIILFMGFSNQSFLTLEGLMLKLKLQYFGHLM